MAVHVQLGPSRIIAVDPPGNGNGGGTTLTGELTWGSTQIDIAVPSGGSADLSAYINNRTGIEPLFRLFDGPALASYGLTFVPPATIKANAGLPQQLVDAGHEFVVQVHQIDGVDPVIPANVHVFGRGSASNQSKGVSYYKVWEEIEHFNGLYWKNWGGDWEDLNGALQGPLSWSPAVDVPVGSAESIIRLNVKALVDAHLAGTPNYGWMVQTTTAATAVLHSNSTTLTGKQKPVLQLNGTINISPEADTYVIPVPSAPGTGIPRGGEAILNVSGGSTKQNTFFFFNLHGVVESPATAELILQATTVPRALAVTLKVMRVYLEDKFALPPYDPVGFANNYNLDVGIANDPNCVFAMDFRDYVAGYSSTNDVKWRDSGWGQQGVTVNQFGNAPPWGTGDIRNAKVIFGNDPDNPVYRPIAPGVPAVKSIMPANIVNDPCFFIGQWYFHGNLGPNYWDTYNQARGEPPGYGHEPVEIWFRYAMFVDETWDPNPQSGKFWGGAWMVYTAGGSGNGPLEPPKPGGPWALYKPNAPGESGNSGTMSFGCAGSSRRSRFHALGLKDLPAQKAGFRSFSTIAEDTVGCLTGSKQGFAIADRTYGWDRDWGWLGWMLKGTWNLIEFRIKQNTIDPSGATKTWIGYPFGGRYMAQADGNSSVNTVLYSSTCSAVGTSNTIVLANRGAPTVVLSASDTWTQNVVIEAADVGDGMNVGAGWGRTVHVTKTGTWVGAVTVQTSPNPTGPWTDAVGYALVIPAGTINQPGWFQVKLPNGLIYVRAGFKAGGYTSGAMTITLKNTSWQTPTANHKDGYCNNYAVEWNGQRRRVIAYDQETYTATISNNLDDAANPSSTTWTGSVPQTGDRFKMWENTSIRQRSTIFYGSRNGFIYADENSVISPLASGDTEIRESQGIGRQDGVHQTWVNGRLAANYTTEEWRCIHEQQIQSIFMSPFMGGQLQKPTQDCALYIALLACGTSRIGHPGGLIGTVTPPGGATITRMAQSASLAHVQAAVTDAVDGDVIGIPNGSATWAGGITTTKQIIIRAQNYTPTPAGTTGAGTMNRSVTITNGTAEDSGIALLDFTSGNSFHCGVGGIRFNETGAVAGAPGPHIRLRGGGSKVPLVFDCAFQIKDRISSIGSGSETAAPLVISCKGGVMWNCVLSGQGFNTNPGNVGPFNSCIAIKKDLNTPVPPAWVNATTMGLSGDPSGDINFYIEDTSLLIVAAAPDVDEHGRCVIRRCSYQGSGIVTHGFTSLWGGRHVEIYDCEFLQVDTDVPLGQGGIDPNFGRNAPLSFWCRAGTAILTNNFYDDRNIGYGQLGALVCSDNVPPPGPYPIPRQPGCGHTGGAGGNTFPPYVIDPIYIWNQTGSTNGRYSVSTDTWSSVIQADRDYFTATGPNPNGIAKPGYSKFTYPHPLRAVVEG